MFPIRPIITGASNSKGGENPPFLLEDFKELYPHFWDSEGKPLAPVEVMEMFLEFAHASVKKSRFHKAWEYCMGLFMAHFITLYLQSMIEPENVTAQAVIGAGAMKGLQASKSVDGVSVSYDFTTALQDLDGWAMWKTTTYGAQFATIAKMYGKGGMYVW